MNADVVLNDFWTWQKNLCLKRRKSYSLITLTFSKKICSIQQVNKFIQAITKTIYSIYIVEFEVLEGFSILRDCLIDEHDIESNSNFQLNKIRKVKSGKLLVNTKNVIFV